MKKNNITNKITPCCGLPFSVAYWWIENLTLNSDADRVFIRNKLHQNGTIGIDAWKVLINSGTLEADASLTKAEFLAWFDCERQPSCEQLKLLIEAFKIGNYNPLNEYGVGWTEISNFEIYNGKIIKKIVGYSGGIGTIPDELQQRIGKYYSDNANLTDNKNLAVDFKGQSGANGTTNLTQFANLSFPVTNTTTEKVQCVENFVPYQLLDGKTSTSADTPSTSPTIWKNIGKDVRVDDIYTNEIIPASVNIADPIGLKKGFYTTAGAYVTSDNWIHWKGHCLPNTQYTASGLGFLGNSNARLIYFTDLGVFISPVIYATNNSANVTFTTPANCYSVAINLQNGLGVGLNPQNSTFVGTLQVEKGGSATPFVPYREEQDLEYVDFNKLGNIPLPDLFYEFNPVGGTNSKGLFIVYSKRHGKYNDYVGFFVNHSYDLSNAVYSNQWRISKANNYKYDSFNHKMKATAEYGGLYEGENEFVYKRVSPDSADFTGGIHGDEILNSVDFLIDGVIIDISNQITLTACNSFRYIQKSTTYTTALVGETLTSHVAEGNHVKITDINLGGYESYNSLTFLINAGTCYFYHGITCIGRTNGNYMINDAGIKIPILADNVTNKLNGVALREVTYSNDITGFGAKVTSNLINNDSKDDLCYLFVHDRATPYQDAKYYRKSPEEVMNSGFNIRSKMRVDFY